MNNIKFFFKHFWGIVGSIGYFIKSLPVIIPAILRGDEVIFHLDISPKENVLSFMNKDGSIDADGLQKFLIEKYEKEE